RKRKAVGRVEGCGLRQDFGEHHDHDGHDDGGIDDPHLAEPGEQDAGRERGGRDIDGVVAEKQRADQSFSRVEQAIDQRGAPIPFFWEPVAGGARARDQGGRAPGKEGGKQEAAENRHKGEPIVGSHRSASFSTRKARTSAASTSGAMKLAPIPRARMKVSLPRLTFLSWAMRSIRRSASGTPPGTEDTWIGRPT